MTVHFGPEADTTIGAFNEEPIIAEDDSIADDNDGKQPNHHCP